MKLLYYILKNVSINLISKNGETMKKASGIVEMALLMGFITIISIVVWNIYNNQKMNLVNMSTVKVRQQN